METKTDPDLDVICEELVEWMDGWELIDVPGMDLFKVETYTQKFGEVYLNEFKTSLDLVREIEEAVEDEGFWNRYGLYLEEKLDTPKLDDFDNPGKSCNRRIYLIATADPKPRLIALHRTLKESGEI